MRFKFCVAAAAFCLTAITSNALAIEGTALSANKPLADASVTLWAAQETGRATDIAKTTSGKDGTFAFDTKPPSDQWIYITAESGPVLQVLILGADRPEKVVLNELGTIASAFTGAQFLDGNNFSGNDLGLRIVAGNVKHFVDPATGEWGKVLVDGNNSSRSTTLARFNTMGNILALCGMPEQVKNCDALLSLDKRGLKNTLGVIQSIAKQPWANANELFELFAKSYVAPKTANPQERRAGVTYVPYLSYTPDDFSLSLKFTGGGITARVGSHSMPTATCGAAKTGCPAPSPAPSTVSEVDWPR